MTSHDRTRGEQIRAAREAAGKSAENLARELGVTVRTVYRWEKDQTTPRPKQMRAIIDSGLGVDEEPATPTTHAVRIKALEYAVSELIVALREGVDGDPARRGEALQNALAALEAAAPAPRPSPLRGPPQARKDR